MLGLFKLQLLEQMAVRIGALKLVIWLTLYR